MEANQEIQEILDIINLGLFFSFKHWQWLLRTIFCGCVWGLRWIYCNVSQESMYCMYWQQHILCKHVIIEELQDAQLMHLMYGKAQLYTKHKAHKFSPMQ